MTVFIENKTRKLSRLIELIILKHAIWKLEFERIGDAGGAKETITI